MKELTFYYGAMGCGKTSELLKSRHGKLEDGFKVIVMKPYVDKKGGSYIISRDERKVEASFLIKDRDNIYVDISKYLVKHNLDYILVDEAQFLTKKHVDELSDIVDILGISVVCYGLKTDFMGNLFEGSKRLLEIADNIIEIKRQCSCGRKKMINMRIVGGVPVFDGEQVAIDGVDAEYRAMCRYCYKNALKETKEE
ncbi:MAG: thymidine kinase [Bacilli bacterium]|nr:thymidine kinase [Bacilli bacterium]